MGINVEAITDKHVLILAVLVPSHGSICSLECYVQYPTVHMEG